MSTPDVPQAGTTGEGAGPATLSLSDLTRIVAAGALVAAGVIHFAFAPVHLDEAFSHGAFFVTAGWLQLGFAGALAFRARPERVWWGLVALVNTAIVGVWVVSRTIGVPGSEREAVAFPDVTSTLLEIVAVLAATALLLDRLPRRQLAGSSFLSLAGVGTVATVALVSVAISPSFAGGHNDGHDGTAADGHAHANGATDQSWGETRLAALEGYAPLEQVQEFGRLSGEYLAEQIRSRSDLLEEMPDAEADQRISTYVDWAVANTLALLEGAQSGTGGNAQGMHSHGPVEWQPITGAADQAELQRQLAAAGDVIQRYPTVADAEADGYRQISQYVPGIGAHWVNGDFDGVFDPGDPEMLLFNGTEPTSELIGLSYATIGPEPPEGFVGPNDQWHAHPALCLLGGFVVGIDGTPEEMCESIGGQIATGLGDLHMAHLWQVPGWENPWGLFGAENPNVNVTTSDLGRPLFGTP